MASNRKPKNKVIAASLSIFIMGLLVLTGPAQGFSLQLGVDDNRPQQGDTITFTVEIEIDSGERLPVEELTLEINGPESLSCEFDVSGNAISGCDDLTITDLQNSNLGFGFGYGYLDQGYNFGYGYGYEQGTLSYQITFNTTNYERGTYTTNLIIKIGNNIFTQQGSTFTIRRAGNGSRSCRTDWQCGDWITDENGLQTRTCEKIINYCSAGAMPETTRTTIRFDDRYEQPINLNSEENSQNAGIVSASIIPVGGDIFNKNEIILTLLILNSIVTALNIAARIRIIKYSRRTRKRIVS